MVPKEFHNLEESLTQRLSLLLYFQYLEKPEKVVAYVPARHRNIVARTYQQFGITPEFPDPTQEDDATEEVLAESFPGMRFGLIKVRDTGPNSLDAIVRARQSLVQGNGAEAVYLELPLNQPKTATLAEAVEAEGFFYAGIGPCFAPDGDTLRMQYLVAPVDTSLLKINSPFAQELLDYIEADRTRVATKTQG